MKDKQILLTMVAFFLLALVLLLFFRDTVVNIFVIPLLYLFWLGDLILKSIDQRYLWWFLLGVMVIIALRGLLQQQRQNDTSSRVSYRQRQTQRVSFWSAQLRRISSGTYPEEYSKYELRKLILFVLGYSVNLSPGEIEQRLKKGEFELPLEVQPGFQFNQKDSTQAKNTFLSRILQRIRLFSFRKSPANSDKVSQEIEETIQYLEKQLEIHREQ